MFLLSFITFIEKTEKYFCFLYSLEELHRVGVIASILLEALFVGRFLVTNPTSLIDTGYILSIFNKFWYSVSFKEFAHFI